MRPHLSPIAAILCLIAGAPAHAVDGFYVQLFGGISALGSTDLDFGPLGSQDDTFDTGGVVGAMAGFDYVSSPWRSGIEFAYRSASSDAPDGDLASTAIGLNAFYAMPVAGRLEPYIGAGLLYFTEIDSDRESGTIRGEFESDGEIGAQIMLGARYALSSALSLSGELRYFDAGNVTLEADDGRRLDVDYSGTEIVLGIGYSF